jgi:hypothetical protein
VGKGSNTTTSTTSSTPDPQAAAAYRDLLTRAQGVASTPYQAYTGDLTAGVNSQQNAGISGINSAAGYANPYIQNASGLAASATAPITAQTIQQYQNPYTQQVVDATTAQMRNEFGQQQASLTGNQIAQGALGGNATGVARGILGGQQGRTMASTVAGLYDKSYQQALSAAQQQQQTGLAGANAQAQYGLSGQNAALTGATAQIGAGSLQQQTEQARLNAAYQQYQQAQAHPYQQAQWLAGMATGVGSNLGGTGTGTTTGPAPNQTGQWIGAGLSAASMFLSDREAKEDIEHIGSLNDGQKIYRYRYKGQPGVHIGLIAQEAEQHNPDSVQRGLGGMRFVDMDEATADAVRERADGGAVFGDYDPPGLAAGDTFAQSSPWQMRPNGNGSVSVINPRTGQVIYTGTPSGAAAAQANAPRQRAAGGGVGAQPWSGGVGWIPQMNIHGGPGAPKGTAPSLPSDKGSGLDPAKAAQGIIGIGKGLGGLDWGGAWDAGLGNLSGDSWGGGSFWKGDTYGGSSASPAAGLSAADYGVGYAAGGAVPGFDDRFNAAYGGYEGYDVAPEPDPENARYREGDGFGDMMNTPDPFGETNRIVAHDALRRGDGIINYSEPPVTSEDGRLMGNQTSAQGVATVPPDTPVMAADEAPEPGLSVPRGRRGVAGAPPVMAADDYYRQPDRAPQREERRGFGLGLLSPNAQTGLLTAGLGMMASRSPFLGNVVGEGGLAGLGAYGAAEQNDQKIAAEAEKLSREARKDAAKFGLDVRKQDEIERHNEATEKTTSAGRAPMGMQFNAKGVLEPIPGWLPTLEKAAKARKGPEGEVMDDDTAQFMADRIIAGDTKVLTGLGRGAQGAANIMKVQKLVAQRAASGEPISPAAREILNNAAQFEGLKTAERTQAAIMAKLSVYGRTAFKATAIAERLSDAVDRTQWQPVNRILNAAREKTGDPKIVALGQALMTLTNEYARAIGGGHGTVHDKEAAEKRLSAVQTKEQLRAVIAVMRQEILAEESAMPEARQHIRDIYNPKPGGAQHSIAGEHGMPPPNGPVPGASGFKPPAGAIPRTYQGKTYYYDPATKQPYPGQ